MWVVAVLVRDEGVLIREEGPEFKGESFVITEDAIEVPASSKMILVVDYMLRAGCQMSIENAQKSIALVR